MMRITNIPGLIKTRICAVVEKGAGRRCVVLLCPPFAISARESLGTLGDEQKKDERS